jgi:serine/threonine-protein kinase HipA
VSDILIVYLRNHRVGRLWLGKGRRFAFQYDESWLANEHAVPLSIAMPLRAEPYDDDVARPFFANLLPEAELRKVIARRLGLSEANDFGLLEAIGGECAGAVSLLPEGVELSEDGEYQPLSDEELNALVRDLPKRPMLAGEAGIRLSLAGVQSKLPVYYDNKSQRVCLPSGNFPSLHILKPPIAHFAGTVENEAFCMQLAERMGLPVPAATILHMEVPLYLVDRYDRKENPDGKIQRLHQEDFCQALGIPPEMKYEKEGGPSLQACFQLLREASIQPVADAKAMLNWVIFNFLIGNADAHGKNVSLLLGDQGPQLAPFYDLMCTIVYPNLTDRLAMRIGGEDRPKWVIARKWEQFAKDIGIGYKMVRQSLVEMSERIVSESKKLKEGFTMQHGECEIIDSIITIIEQRARKVLTSLNAAK